MNRVLMTAAIAALTLAASACTNDNPSPTSPGPSSAPPPDALVIDIVADNGSRSFNPNPAAVPPGKTDPRVPLRRRWVGATLPIDHPGRL